MKNHNNFDMLAFLGGLVMLISGLYWFLSSVRVTTGFYGLRLGGFSVSSGLVVVPLLVGVVLLFFDVKSFVGRLLAGGGLVIIIASVIASTRFVMRPVSLYSFLLMLAFVVGGAALVAKAVWNGRKKG